MKEKIEEKLSKYAETLLGKDEMQTEDVNFLIFWLNRMECKEQQEIFKKNEEEMKAEREATNEALRKSMYSMLENIKMGG